MSHSAWTISSVELDTKVGGRLLSCITVDVGAEDLRSTFPRQIFGEVVTDAAEALNGHRPTLDLRLVEDEMGGRLDTLENTVSCHW